jgi:hypothetical protein
MALGTIFGSIREKAIGDWKKLNNQELQHLYRLPNIIIDQIMDDVIDGTLILSIFRGDYRRGMVW